MTVYQNISPNGFVIGVFDPHGEQAPVVDAVLESTGGIVSIVKADPPPIPWANILDPNKSGSLANTVQGYLGNRDSKKKKPAESRRMTRYRQNREERVKRAEIRRRTKLPMSDRIIEAATQTRGGRAAMVGVPVAALAYTNRDKIASASQSAKEKVNQTADVRRNRPATLYYDDGFGKAAEEEIAKLLDERKVRRTERRAVKEGRLAAAEEAIEDSRRRRSAAKRGPKGPARGDKALAVTERLHGLLPRTTSGKAALAAGVPATILASSQFRKAAEDIIGKTGTHPDYLEGETGPTDEELAKIESVEQKAAKKTATQKTAAQKAVATASGTTAPAAATTTPAPAKKTAAKKTTAKKAPAKKAAAPAPAAAPAAAPAGGTATMSPGPKPPPGVQAASRSATRQAAQTAAATGQTTRVTASTTPPAATTAPATATGGAGGSSGAPPQQPPTAPPPSGGGGQPPKQPRKAADPAQFAARKQARMDRERKKAEALKAAERERMANSGLSGFMNNRRNKRLQRKAARYEARAAAQETLNASSAKLSTAQAADTVGAARKAAARSAFVTGATHAGGIAALATALGTGGVAASRKIASMRADRAALKAARNRPQGMSEAKKLGLMAAVPTAVIGGSEVARRRRMDRAQKMEGKDYAGLTKSALEEFEKGAKTDAVKNALKKLKPDPAKGPVADRIAAANTKLSEMSGDATRTSRNARATMDNVRSIVGGKYAPKQGPPALTTAQKVGIGAAAGGGLLLGRQLAGPKPYPYQQTQQG